MSREEWDQSQLFKTKQSEEGNQEKERVCERNIANMAKRRGGERESQRRGRRGGNRKERERERDLFRHSSVSDGLLEDFSRKIKEANRLPETTRLNKG